MLLSNLYLHYVLDLWFERVVKSRLRGEARLVRYIDDFVICFQYRSDAIRVQDALRLRLGKFGLTLEPTKTKLVEFGRFAQRHAGKRGRIPPGNYLLPGPNAVLHAKPKRQLQGWDAHREISVEAQPYVSARAMRRIRHHTIGDQVGEINAVLRGHYAYYGVAGNYPVLSSKVYRVVGALLAPDVVQPQLGRTLASPGTLFNQIKERTPLLKPKLRLPYPGVAGSCSAVNQLPKSVVREIRTPRSVGTGGGSTASGDPVLGVPHRR